MLIAFLLSAAQAAPVPGTWPLDRLDLATAKARLARCGLGTVITQYNAELQSERLIPASPENATEEQLACADKATSYHEVELPAGLKQRFDAIRAARFRPIVIADSRRRLTERQREAPEYKEGVTSDLEFTREVERRCGPSASGAFGSRFGLHTLSPEWLRRQMEGGVDSGDPLYPTFACVTDMAMVAGFELGFIGNEAVANPD